MKPSQPGRARPPGHNKEYSHATEENRPCKWYRTKQGTGKVLRVGGTHPPSVEINITLPFPRGTVFVSPRDVLEEVPAPDQEENTP
jgi:hypothetical protein